MKKHSLILALAIALLAVVSCARGGRVIPASTMSDIYADMLMADQWINQHPRARKTADTTNFYAPILEQYGYTVEDYDASMRHYLKKPDNYAKILKAAGAKLTKQQKRLEAIEDAIKKRVKFSPYVPTEFRYDTLVFKNDTLGLWPNDSSFVDPVADSLALADSSKTELIDSAAIETIKTKVERLDSIAASDNEIEKLGVQVESSFKALTRVPLHKNK